MGIQYECLMCGFQNGFNSVWTRIARVHLNTSYVPLTCQCGMVFKRHPETVKHLKNSQCTMVVKGMMSQETPFAIMMGKHNKRTSDTILPLPKVPEKRPALATFLFEDISDCELDYIDDLPGTPLLDEKRPALATFLFEDISDCESDDLPGTPILVRVPNDRSLI